MPVARPSPALCRLRLEAVGELAPFASPAAAEAAVAALRDAAASAGIAVLAFCALPRELDVLVESASDGFARELARLVTRRANAALGRRGSLLRAAAPVWIEPDAGDDVVRAVEQRAVDGELAAEPADTPWCSAHPAHDGWLRRVPTRAPRSAGGAVLTVGEVVRVAEVERVVQLARVEALLDDLQASSGQADEALAEQVREYVARWYLDDRRALSTVRAVLAGLARQEPGGGWLVSGLYGAGKSHLLAVLALLAEWPSARDELFAAHPELVDLRAGWLATGRRLAVLVALDEVSPAVSLEEAVFRAAEQTLLRRTGITEPLAEVDFVLATVRQHLLPNWGAALDRFAGEPWEALAGRDAGAAAGLAQRFVTEQRLPYRFTQSRVERLGRLHELAAAAGYSGVVLLLDEVSTFLSARPTRGREADASLLQFLGQRAALGPLWVVGALRKQIEDVGSIEHYALRQIKDRFETRLTLPLAAARQVLSRKVLPRRSETLLRQAVNQSLSHWRGAAPSRELTAARLAETWPLHPLAFDALEACAERFLAQTRSIVEFAATRVRGDELGRGLLDRPAATLVLPDELWTHFRRDVVRHPELHGYAERVAEWYEHNLPSLLDDEADLPLARRLVELLLVLAVAGLERPAGELACALLPWSEDRGERVAGLLERLRTRGDYVRREPRDGPLGDVYSIDLELDLNSTIARRARSIAATLTLGDARLSQIALGACGEGAFPLAAALRPRAVDIDWRHTRRGVFVALRDLTGLSATELRNQAGLLAGRELAEACYVWLAEPQRVERQQEAFAAALASVEDERWRHSLAAWLPREATAAEREQWLEWTSLELLRGDPTLGSRKLGEALAARLDEEAEQRRAGLAALARRLYQDGQSLTAAGLRPIAEAELSEALTALAGSLLERLFPRAHEVAPRRPLPGGVGVDALIDELLLPGEVHASPASVLTQAVEALALPLGLAEGEYGEYRLRREPGPAGAALLAALPERPVALIDAERFLVKSEFGLSAPHAHLVIAGLIRTGHLTGLGAGGERVPLGSPLRALVAAVAPTPRLTPAAWQALAPAAAALLGQALPELTAGAQQELYERLLRWRRAVPGQVELLRAGIRRAVERLNHDELQWRLTASLADWVLGWSEALAADRSAPDALAEFAGAAGEPGDEVAERWSRFRVAVGLFESRLEPLIAAADELRLVELPADSPLAAEREQLLLRFTTGEELIDSGAELLADCAAWRRRYTDAYTAWHAEVHASERYAAYDAFRVGPAMRVLSNLSRLLLEAPSGAGELAEALAAERRKQCRRAELQVALRERLTCPECGLLLGQSVTPRPVAELEAQARHGIDTLLERLAAQRQRIERGLADLPGDDPRLVHVARLLSPERDPAALLPWCGFAVVDLLNAVLSTEAAARRSLGELTAALAGRTLAKRDVQAAVEAWLDPRGRLGPDDRIELSD